MKRRAMLAAVAAGAVLEAQVKPPIQLHVDLMIDLAKEKNLLENYRKVFRPAMMKQPGFVDVKLMKLREAKAGKAPEGMNYRLLISFKTEEDRLNWVKTNDHQIAWPTMEGTFKVKTFTAVLFDLV
jgi:hypothetical protein